MPIKDYVKNKEYQKQYQKKYQKKYQRKTRENKTIIKKPFMSFDGETENNLYTLFGNSENYIYNKRGLSTYECIKFLWNEGKGKIKIIFAIHFDIQFWIRDLSDEKIIDLLNGLEIDYYKWKLRYFTKKYLIIQYGNAKVYIYDIISFFQTSFLKTVEQMQLDLTNQEKNILEKGKKLRGKNFKNMTLAQIIEYNKTECIIAEKVAYKLRNILINAVIEFEGKSFNLLPKRFYGSGAIAKEILTNLGFEEHAKKEKELSESIKEYITMSYYGGRFEVFKVGTFKEIYKYDINSAYPFAMSEIYVPNKFKRIVYKDVKKKIDFIDTNIYLVEWNFEKADEKLLGILPFRRKDGYVIFPKKGKGYYFGKECKFLNDLKKITFGSYKVYSELQVTFKKEKLFPKGCIEYIYEKRIELKNKKDVSQIAYKLAMNSIYGKLAQQSGYRQFTQVYIASLITASCRAQILEVIFKNDVIKNVVQISTDGIFLDNVIKKINISKKLGHWDFEKYEKSQILGSGIYSLTNKKETKYALRGIEVSKDNFEKIINKLQKENKAEIYYKCFIGHKFALANHIKYLEHRLKFTEIKKSVSLYNYEKRYFLKQNGINKISIGLWIDIFNGKEIEMTNKLKKLDEKIDLENEAITLETK